MADRDWAYRTLEIEPKAAQEQIRAAYRTLTRVWHPDRLGSDPKLRSHAEEKLKQINAAYELLRFDDDVGARKPPSPPDGPTDVPREPAKTASYPVEPRRPRVDPPRRSIRTSLFPVSRTAATIVFAMVACLLAGLAFFLIRTPPGSLSTNPVASTPPGTGGAIGEQGGLPLAFSKEIEGTIGSRTGLLMRITRKGADVFGMYTWVDSAYVPRDRQIAVRGRIENDGRLRVAEYRNFVGEGESVTGMFEGRLRADAGSNRLVFEGVWRTNETAEGTPCRFSERIFGLPLGIALVTKRVQSEYSDPEIRVDLEYPQLESADGGLVERFNRLTEELATEGAATFVELMRADGPMPFDSSIGSAYDFRYHVLYGRSGLISIRFEVESYSEGAVHQQFRYDELTYDVGRAARVALRELYHPGYRYLEVLSDYCLNDPDSRLSIISSDGLMPLAENFRVWNVTASGLLITFPPYQVGSFADGTQQVNVPYRLFGSALSAETLPRIE